MPPHKAATSQSENDVVSLINWSVGWVRILSIGFLFISLQSLFFAFYGIFSAEPVTYPFWESMNAIAYSILSLWLSRYANSGSTYVRSEREEDLGKCMVYLSTYFICLPLALLTTVLKTASLELKLPMAQSTLWFFIPLVMLGISYLLFRWESRAPYNQEAFTKYIRYFAVRNLRKTLLLSLFSFSGGLALIFMGVTEEVNLSGTLQSAIVLTGVSLIGPGCALWLYWRSIRDIHRNPLPVYFERTLARLGLYWFVAPLFAGLQFLVNFFAH